MIDKLAECAAPGVHDVAEGMLGKGNGALLDSAAGSGSFSSRMANRGWNVTSCDLHPEHFLAEGIVCFKADLNGKLPFPDNSFSAVAALEVIEHLENPRGFMREIFRVLQPGGQCVLSTPNVLSLYSRVRFLLFGAPSYFDLMAANQKTSEYYYCSGHIQPVSFSELHAIFREQGWDFVRVKTNQDIRFRLKGWRRMAAWAMAALISMPIRIATRLRGGGDTIAHLVVKPELLYGDEIIVLVRKPGSIQ